MVTRIAVLMAAAAFALCACGGGGSGGSSGPPAPTPPAPPAITGPPGTLAAATAGTAFPGATITATGATPITFAVTAGSLPDGMTLDSNTGNYSGTPLILGDFAFTVTATNSAGTANAQFTQAVNPAVPNANLLLTGNRLVSFNTAVPTALEAPVTLVGVAAGEELVAIARRPNNGFLYGLSVNPGPGLSFGAGRVYVVHASTGVATALGEPAWFVEPDTVSPNPIWADRFGAHVSPAADVLRVANDVGQNFRFELNWGTTLDGQAPANDQMDSYINGFSDSVDSLAYTNNQLGATSSTLYTIDPQSHALCIQETANSGHLGSCWILSEQIDAALGFDIAPGVNSPAQGAPVTSGSGIAIIRLAGQTTERLATIDLATGTVSDRPPAIGSGGIRSLALQAPSGAPMYALSGDGTQLLVFSSADPGAVTTRNISGVLAGEHLVGIDFHPTIGRLYGLGVNPGTNTGSLYFIHPQNGGATSPAPGAIALASDSGTPRDLPGLAIGYGFSYDPTTGYVRVVTGSDLNFRIHGTDGTVIDANPNLPGLQADADLDAISTAEIAHTNSLDIGDNITTLYAMEAGMGRMCVQAPNAGTLNMCQTLTLGGTLALLLHLRGFDIPGHVRAPASDAPVTAGFGYLAASLSPGTDYHLYEVELATGALTDRGQIGDGSVVISGLAAGIATVR